MTEREARKLKIGDKVQWPDGTYGEVVETGYAAVSVKWNDGQYSIVQFDNAGTLREQLQSAN